MGLPEIPTAMSRWLGWKSPVAIIALVAVLTACSSGPPASGTDPAEPSLVEVNVSVIGGPQSPDGTLAARQVSLAVLDPAGAAVTFNEDLVVDQEGAVNAVTLDETVSVVTYYLHEGQRYLFEAAALDAAGNFLAFGTGERTVASGGSNATLVNLTGHLGEASLTPRLPVNQVLPGQELDLILLVNPPGRPELHVTGTDYTAHYAVANSTVISESSYGVLVRTGNRDAGDLEVTATANGRIVAADSSVAGEIQAFTTLPFATGVTVDLEPPSISTLAFDQVRQIFNGIADDNFGIGRVDLLDGPKPLASTDPDAISQSGLAEIFFPDGGTAFYTELSLAPGQYELTVVVHDTSGNASQSSLDVIAQ